MTSPSMLFMDIHSLREISLTGLCAFYGYGFPTGKGVL